MMFKFKTFAVLSVLLVICYSATAQKIPKLGVVYSLEQDSLIYASGFTMLGESVGKMISPSLTEDQFNSNLLKIKNAKCKLYVCNVFFPSQIKIAGPEVNEKRVLAYADSVFKRAKKAGVRLIVLGSSGARRLPEGYDQEKAKVEFAALCRKLAVSAKKYQVTIALESLETAETNFLLTLKSAAEVVRIANHPNFRLNADIFHMMREGESAESILAAGDVLAYCEVAEKEARTFPGVKGDDFKPYFRALKEVNFKGKIFIEGNTKDPQKDLPLSYQYLTKQLKEVYSEK